MPIYEHRKESHLRNPQLSSWLNVIPSLESKHVVIVGIENVEILNSLIICKPKALTYIGSKKNIKADSIIKYVEDFTSFLPNSIDFFIVNDIESFLDLPDGSLQSKLKKCYSILNDRGVLLIGMQGCLKKNVAKFTIKKLINSIGFTQIKSFLCEPSFQSPIFIYPFSQSPKFTQKMLTKDLFRNIKTINLIKDFVKLCLFKLTVYNNPLTGMFITATKGINFIEDESLFDWIDANNEFGLADKDNISTIWLSKPYLAKQVGLIFNLCNEEKRLIAVYKQANIENHRAPVVENEHKALSLLLPFHELLYDENIIIPKPIYLKYDHERIKSLESAVSGDPISNSGIPLPKNNTKIPARLLIKENIIDELVNKQIIIQELLTKNLKNKLPIVNEKYFINKQSFTSDYFDNNGRFEFYKNFTQHGDYTMVNFLYDSNKCKWGIIDWEWLATGYPPLFDLFYLFTSARFREIGGKNLRMFENDFQSFIDTFFKKNHFSESIMMHSLHYCSHFKIQKEQIYNYFLDFLLFNYNKFRLDFNLPQFELLYKDMLDYSLKNEDRFILNVI